MTRPVDAPRTWRQQLDARIDRCPGCDWWRWDRLCAACTGPVDDELSVVAQMTDITHIKLATEEAA